MKRYDVITLVGETPQAHGIFDNPVEPKREVMVEVRSVGMKEMYSALSVDMRPSYVFIINAAEEYDNEEIVIYQNRRYSVIRTYWNKYDQIELTVEPAGTAQRNVSEQRSVVNGNN